MAVSISIFQFQAAAELSVGRLQVAEVQYLLTYKSTPAGPNSCTARHTESACRTRLASPVRSRECEVVILRHWATSAASMTPKAPASTLIDLKVSVS
jgi:hypothetical protein